MPTNIIQFKRAYNGKDVVTGQNYLALDSQAFTLNQVSNYSDITSMFEFYRICAVAITFAPRFFGTNTSTQLGNLHYCIDVNDVTQPSQLSDIQQYPSYKMIPLDKPRTVYLKPRCADTYYQGITASGYGMGAKGAWLDTKSPGVQHYGIKYVVDNAAASTTVATTYLTLYLQCKGVS